MAAEGRPVTHKLPHIALEALHWGEGMPLLALHGWHDNAASFGALAPLLDGVELIAPELAGHGHSGWRPPGQAYHLIDYVNDILALIDHHGWDELLLMGHSLGAGLASLVSAALPARIKALVLIEGTAPLSRPPEENPPQLWPAYRTLRLQGRRRRPVYADLAEAAQRRAQRGGLGEAAALALATRGTEAVEGGVRWRNDPRLDVPSAIYLTEEQVLAFLGAIAAPTLLIEASGGLLAGRRTTAGRAAAIQGLHHLHLPGRHHLHLEDPIPVADAINEFLAVHRRN